MNTFQQILTQRDFYVYSRNVLVPAAFRPENETIFYNNYYRPDFKRDAILFTNPEIKINKRVNVSTLNVYNIVFGARIVFKLFPDAKPPPDDPSQYYDDTKSFFGCVEPDPVDMWICPREMDLITNFSFPNVVYNENKTWSASPIVNQVTYAMAQIYFFNNLPYYFTNQTELISCAIIFYNPVLKILYILNLDLTNIFGTMVANVNYNGLPIRVQSNLDHRPQFTAMNIVFQIIWAIYFVLFSAWIWLRGIKYFQIFLATHKLTLDM